VNRLILPLAPTGTITKFWIVWPAALAFTLDVIGCIDPDGQTATYPAASVWVIVTLRAATATPVVERYVVSFHAVARVCPEAPIWDG
jgi:hypothetical protein